MADNMKLMYTRSAYNTFCKALDNLDWNYTRNDEEFTLSFGVSGDDLNMSFLVVFDNERQLIRLVSLLPFMAKEDKWVEAVLATTAINFLLADGSFDVDIGDKNILFRLTSTYRESIIDEELAKYMISVACLTVDKYNQHLFALNEGNITLNEFFDIVERRD